VNKFMAPGWCKLKYNSVKDAILGAAELRGAKIFQSVSFIFRIDDYNKLQKYLKKYGKESVNKAIMELVEASEE